MRLKKMFAIGHHGDDGRRWVRFKNGQLDTIEKEFHPSCLVDEEVGKGFLLVGEKRYHLYEVTMNAVATGLTGV